MKDLLFPIGPVFSLDPDTSTPLLFHNPFFWRHVVLPVSEEMPIPIMYSLFPARDPFFLSFQDHGVNSPFPFFVKKPLPVASHPALFFLNVGDTTSFFPSVTLRRSLMGQDSLGSFYRRIPPHTTSGHVLPWLIREGDFSAYVRYLFFFLPRFFT